MSSDDRDSLVRKRRQVGHLAVGCLVAGGTATLLGHGESFWAGPCVRIGLLLGAVWLAFPGRTRTAAWTFQSRGILAGLILLAIFWPRLAKLRFALPLLLLGFLLGWLIRPRQKRKS